MTTAEGNETVRERGVKKYAQNFRAQLSSKISCPKSQALFKNEKQAPESRKRFGRLLLLVRGSVPPFTLGVTS
jgi:hypothetical protein